MKKILAAPALWLLRLGVFWLLFFGVFRLWFVLNFKDRWPVDNPGAVWSAFRFAWTLDLSFAGYLLAVPALLWHLGVLGNSRWRAGVAYTSLGFNFLLINVLVLLFGANVFLYTEWDTLLNNRALAYLSTPAALLDSMSLTLKAVALMLYLLFAGGLCWAYRRVFHPKMYTDATSRWWVLGLPVWAGLLLLAIRGGLGVMPVNESVAYRSPHTFVNHAATNTGWHFVHSLIETRATTNHYEFLPKEEAEQIRANLKTYGVPNGDASFDNLVPAVDSTHPANVVLLVMESETAQVVAELGGEPDLSPNLSRLIREGILFENCYGSGYRTDQGLISVLAGYPAQPDQSVVLQSEKAEKLPSLARIFQKKDYATAFYYGGELTFANIGVWLRGAGFDRVVSETDFGPEAHTQRWGVDDHHLLNRFCDDLSALPQPFFATAMTLSLHPPFDVPQEFSSRWQGKGNEHDDFRHSAAFADWAIGEFFKKAATQPWFNRTLFVLVADHGNPQPGGLSQDDPRARHVPLILYSPSLNPVWKGQRLKVFGNHHAIPATVLDFLDFKEQAAFDWGTSLLWANSVEYNSLVPNRVYGDFAYYTNENGLGWATPSGTGFYHFATGQWEMKSGTLTEEQKRQAQAYLQVLYADFLAL